MFVVVPSVVIPSVVTLNAFVVKVSIVVAVVDPLIVVKIVVVPSVPRDPPVVRSMPFGVCVLVSSIVLPGVVGNEVALFRII